MNLQHYAHKPSPTFSSIPPTALYGEVLSWDCVDEQEQRALEAAFVAMMKGMRLKSLARLLAIGASHQDENSC